MKEFEFINLLSDSFGKTVRGIGDDCALMGDNTLIAKDIMAEGVHFLKSTPIEHIIHKLFTANISDIASMGGTAESALLGVAAPCGYDLSKLAAAVIDQARYYNINIIGGDTSQSKADLFLSLTIIGRKGKNILQRSGAKPGDILYLSRPVGLSMLSLEKELGQNDFDIDRYAHCLIDAETKLGAILGEMDGVTSCTDVSDGLGVDSNNIALASGVKIIIDNLNIRFTSLSKYPIDTCIYALTSGEEFALLFTLDDKHSANIERELKDKTGVDIIKIGYIYSGNGVFLNDKKLTDISQFGFEHFNL